MESSTTDARMDSPRQDGPVLAGTTTTTGGMCPRRPDGAPPGGTSDPREEKRTRPWLLAFWMAVLTAGGLWLAQPPEPLPADAPLQAFAAGRALRHVEAIARDRHRSGSPAGRAVARYLADELRGLGLTPSIHEVAGSFQYNLFHPVNIVARLPGRRSGRAFVLMAHYDSAPMSRGAADNGAAVAALLETARALLAGPPLEQDVFLVFTDGEEIALLGGETFDQLPVASETALVLNFEARGVGGPSYLFQTSADNGWLIRQLTQVSGPVFGSSMMDAIYRALPFRNDLDAVRETHPGFAVAFIDGLPRYHTVLDDPGHLDPRSLQNQGVYALNAARHFGNLDLSQVATAPDAVYFNPVGGWLVAYPEAWTWPLTFLNLGLLTAVILIGTRRRRLSWAGMRQALAGQIGEALLVLLVISLGTAITLLVRGKYALYDSDLFLAAGGAATLAIGLSRLRWIRQRVEPADLAVGSIGTWVPVLLAVSWRWPGAAFILHWPMLFGLLGLLAGDHRGDRPPQPCSGGDPEDGLPDTTLPGERGQKPGPASRSGSPPRQEPAGERFDSPETRWIRSPGWLWPVPALVATPTLLLLPPVLWMLHQALTVPGLPLLMTAVSLGGAALVPLLLPVAEATPTAWTRTTMAGAAFLWLAGLAVGGGGPERPRFDSLGYAADLESQSYHWVSRDEEADAWTHRFFPATGTVRRVLGEFTIQEDLRCASAPALPTSPSIPRVIGDTLSGSGTRLLDLEITPGSETAQIWMVGVASQPFLALVADGIPIPMEEIVLAPGRWMLDWLIVPEHPAVFRIEAAASVAIYLELVDVVYRLPDLASLGLPQRPAGLGPVPNTVTGFARFETDTTLIRQVWMLTRPDQPPTGSPETNPGEP